MTFSSEKYALDCDADLFLRLFGPDIHTYTHLMFNGEKIIIREKGVTIIDATTQEFMRQFNKLIFTDKNGKETVFIKQEEVSL